MPHAIAAKRRTRLLAVVIIALGLIAYSNSFAGVFVFDDFSNIHENPNVRTIAPLSHDLTANRPLVDLSLAMNYALGGEDPFGYHAVNLLIHLAAALALFALIRRALASPRLDARPRRWHDLFAFAVTGLWVVHPLTTQAVTYIIQRGESLASLFILLTLLAAARSADERQAHKLLWTLVAIACCALGMMSKQIVAATPLLVVLYDRSFTFASWRAAFARRWKLYAGLAATWLILAATVGFGRELLADDNSVGFASQSASPLDYLATQSRVLPHYLRLALLPIGQCFDYGWRIDRFSASHLPTLGALGLLVLGALGAAWRGHWLGFVGLACLSILAPTSSIVPLADAAVEHRMYLPLAGVLVVLVAVCHALLRRFVSASPSVSRVGPIAALCVAMLLTALTIERNMIYHSRAALWRSVIALRPANPRAHSNLGKALRLEGASHEAIAHLREALRLEPDFAMASYNLGAELTVVGKPRDAIAALTHSLTHRPGYKFTHFQLGLAYATVEEHDQAIAHYRAAIELDPDYHLAHYNLAGLHAKRDETNACITHLREAVRIEPQFALAHYRLGHMLRATGQYDQAAAHLRRCIAIDGPHPTITALLNETLAEAVEAKARRNAAIAGVELKP